MAIAPDTPGYGNSTKPEASLSMKELGQVIAEALEGLGYGENGKAAVISSHHLSLGTGGAPENAELRAMGMVQRYVIGRIYQRATQFKVFVIWK